MQYMPRPVNELLWPKRYANKEQVCIICVGTQGLYVHAHTHTHADTQEGGVTRYVTHTHTHSTEMTLQHAIMDYPCSFLSCAASAKVTGSFTAAE